MKKIDNKEKDILLTRREAAEWFGCKESTLAVWACKKQYSLPCIKLGNAVRYSVSDVLKFIEKYVKK